MKWLGWESFELPAEVSGGLTETDNLAYAKTLMVCAGADGTIAPAERDWVVGYLATAGSPDAVVEAMQTYQGGDSLDDLLGATPDMPVYRHCLLYDALRACASDGELSPEERSKILAAADRMGVPRAVVEDLEDIVAQEQQLRRRRHQVIVADAYEAAAT